MLDDSNIFLFSVALTNSLGTVAETYFQIDTSLLAISSHIFQVHNELNYTLGFCAARCDMAGALACQFFVYANATCYLGDWDNEYTGVVSFDFGYETAYYRESELVMGQFRVQAGLQLWSNVQGLITTQTEQLLLI